MLIFMVLHKLDSLHKVDVCLQLKCALLIEGVLTSVKHSLGSFSCRFEALQVMESQAVWIDPIARQRLDLARMMSLRLNIVSDLFHLHSVRPVSLAFED